MRIRTRLIGAALAVVALANVVYAGYVIRTQRASQLAQLHATIEETNRLLNVVNAGPLYDGNVEQLKTNLDSFFRNPDILSITLAENGGDVALSRARSPSDDAGERLESRVVITRGIDELGTVNTVYTTANIEHRLRTARYELLFFSAGLAAALLIVIFLVTSSMARPIERLTAAAQAMADGKLDQDIDTRGVDELSSLGRSFSRMRDAINQKIADLAENNQRLNQEIAQRRDAELERDRLVSVIDATTDIVGMSDAAGNVLYFNRAGQTLLGIKAKGHLDTMLPKVHPAWAAGIIRREGIPAAIRDGVWAGETAVIAAGGREIPVSQVILGHKDRQGNLLFLSTIMRDITERRRAEQTLQRLNEELEQRVAQRTAEMAAARDEAERANLAKSEFLSRMSHELRTPMNAILGFAQLLEIDPSVGARQKDWILEIVKGGRHLLDLINDVLDLARVESGKFTISAEPVALQALLADCQMLLRPLAETSSVRLLDASRYCNVHVRADRTRLKQVLLNLLSNAVKYNRPQGSVSVVCVEESDGPVPSVQIRISDTGVGIPPEQQSRLFVPFERLDADRQRIEGTGIGLALCKRLVEAMGGTVGVESTPGSGSTFWVKLPMSDGSGTGAPTPPADTHVPVTEAHGGRRFDVLCIEDNPANLRLIEGVFAARDNIRLLSAMAPSLGLELARTHKPALILLDINLPEMDGYAVMRCLRESEATRNIPVVAISANAMPKDIEMGKAAGFLEYLTKPIDLARLLAVVDPMLAS